MPQAYFWVAYAEVVPQEQHRATGKGAGQTCHIERFNNILRQRLGRFVRRTLSFSQTEAMHENCLKLFLHEYNTQHLTTSMTTLPKHELAHKAFAVDVGYNNGVLCCAFSPDGRLLLTGGLDGILTVWQL